MKLANSRQSAYHLNNNSYLDPDAEWGMYDYEKGKSEENIIVKFSPVDEDDNAEDIVKDDSEEVNKGEVEK